MSSTNLDDASFFLIETDSTNVATIQPGKAMDGVTCQNSINPSSQLICGSTTASSFVAELVLSSGINTFLCT